MRNGLQHVDGEFRTCAANVSALWGSLGWFWLPDGDPVVQGKVYGYWAGAIRSGATAPLINPAGRDIHRPIGLVTLSAFGETANLSDYMTVVVKIAKSVDQALRQTARGVQRGGGSDVIFSADVTFHSPQPQTPASSGAGAIESV